MPDGYLTQNEFANVVGVSRTQLYNVDGLTKQDGKYLRSEVPLYYQLKNQSLRVLLLGYDNSHLIRMARYYESKHYSVEYLLADKSWYLSRLIKKKNPDMNWLWYQLPYYGSIGLLGVYEGSLGMMSMGCYCG